jgi:hypothetical protein
VSAFEIPFRSLWARLAAWIIPAAGVGLRGALILSAGLMFASGIWFNWFSDESPIPGGPDDGLFQYSVVAIPQDAMAATLAAHATHAASLANIDGVVAAGVGLTALGQPAVKVYVSEIGVAALPATLDAGVPVSVEVIGEVWAWGHAPGTQQALEASDATPASRFERPVPIGVSSGHPSITAGTIGARVTDGSKIYALSNNHVFAAENQAEIDDKILQPGPVDGGVNPTDAFGTLADFEPVKFGFGTSNTMDAAIALSSAEDLGKATLGDGYGEPLAETVKAKISQGVKKYGRTTGFTQGKVDAIMATVNVRYRKGSARFVNQILIKPGGFSAGGDSGSLVVANGGKDDNKPVGLVFAGSTLVSIANPIDPVLERFGVTVDGN